MDWSSATHRSLEEGGGARSLAPTFLCPNSLLTGEITGNFENFALQNCTTLLYSTLNCTFRERSGQFDANRNRELMGTYQGNFAA